MSLDDITIAKLGWRFGTAEQSALELEDLLSSHGITVARGSYLEEHILRVLRVAASPLMVFSSSEDVRPYFRSLIGVHELARLVVAVRTNPSFPELIPHLHLLNEGSALQIGKSSGRDSATNKLFELFCAVLAMGCSDRVSLDDPESSTGDNPDVLAVVGVEKWGIACKVLHSDHPEGFLEHLRKGVDQINRSSASVGIVAFNLKNILDDDLLWPLKHVQGQPSPQAAAWKDVGDAFNELYRQMNAIGQRLSSWTSDAPQVLSDILSGSKSVPAFLLWGHAATGVMINGLPMPTSARHMQVVAVGEVLDHHRRFLEFLHWAALSDSPGRGPRPAV